MAAVRDGGEEGTVTLDEQAILGTSAIRATFVFDEWSESPAPVDARKAPAQQEARR